MPPGDRTYAYAAADQRLIEDRFDAVPGSGYWIERIYGDEGSHDGYDEVGNLVDVRGGSSEAGDPAIAATYGYDRRNRLSSWQRAGGVEEHYSYDPLGNLVGYATTSAGAGNQGFGEADGSRPHAVTSSTASGGTVDYTYDADGNLASALGAGSRYYRFDWANRLVGVGTSPGSTGMLAVTYDASGARLAEWTTAGGLRVFFDEHVTFRRGESPPSGFDAMEIRIFAFGETLAVKRRNRGDRCQSQVRWGL